MMRVGALVGLGDRRGVGLGAHLEVVAVVDLEDRRAGLEREPADGGDDTGVIHGVLPGDACGLRGDGMDQRPGVCKHRRATGAEGDDGRERRSAATLTLQTIAMPADTNANGDIFGGWLMAQMDLGASVLARGRGRAGRVATVAVEGMTFHRPVRVGDVVSIYAELLREGAHLDDDRHRGLGARASRRGERLKVTRGELRLRRGRRARRETRRCRPNRPIDRRAGSAHRSARRAAGRGGDERHDLAADAGHGQPELDRVMGPKLLLLFIVGDILGTGVYALTGHGGGRGRRRGLGAVPRRLLVATITAFSYLELVTRYPQAAGAALYTHRAFGLHFLTFLVAFTVMCSGITSASTASNAFAGFLSRRLRARARGAAAPAGWCWRSASWRWSRRSTSAASARA